MCLGSISWLRHISIAPYVYKYIYVCIYVAFPG